MPARRRRQCIYLRYEDHPTSEAPSEAASAAWTSLPFDRTAAARLVEM